MKKPKKAKAKVKAKSPKQNPTLDWLKQAMIVLETRIQDLEVRVEALQGPPVPQPSEPQPQEDG
jgi:hypothetical protein